MLRVGDRAPTFSAHAADGRPISLAGLGATPVILYFFPKAFSPHCTIETKGFRDNYAELREQGFEVIGISTDAEATQCRFAEKLGVTFPMIADYRGGLARSFGVLWPIIPIARRITYVLDEQHVVAAVFHHEFQVSKHLDQVLRFCAQWNEDRAATEPALQTGFTRRT